MGRAIDTIAGYATNPGTTPTEVTPLAGHSVTVKNFPTTSRAYLVTVWSPGATAGIVRIRSPRLHDAQQGIRLQRAAGSLRPLYSEFALQLLYPSDKLTIEVTGGTVETDMAVLLVYYEDLPGVNARLETYETVRPNITNIIGVELALTSGTAGNYGSTRSITADFDLLKANVDYALLGYVCRSPVGLISINGPDLGNMDVSFPGITETEITRSWFVWLSRQTGFPCIPIINAANKNVTLLKSADPAANTAATISLILAELR